jgi:deoxyribodipyrimidine photo-lyase
MQINIWWMRRDLRLNDNDALLSALQGGGGVIPLFIVDPAFDSSRGSPRYAFLMQALRNLDSDLQQRGSRLMVRAGRPLDVLRGVVAESGAAAIYAEGDASPYARRRDAAIARHLPLQLVGNATVHPPSAVVKADGSPYRVFTPFSNAWRALPLVQPRPAPYHFVPAARFDSLPLPFSDTAQASLFPASESAAQQRLAEFCAAELGQYGLLRERMDLDGTSRLSPALRFGLLSARQVVFEARRGMESGTDAASRNGAETWQNELIWREFYQMILYHFPFVLKTAFRADLRGISWREADADLHAWQTGQTGFPVVDAGMRELACTGWMHNRARMITASFLVKDLLINWQEGERWFMQHLLDGDPAANNGGWQWTAGVGTDAAPYFRVFSPRLQGEKFDPQGDYVRRWVPELAGVPLKYIHQPELMPEGLQKDLKCVIGRDYPRPIVDHTQARLRALAAYKAARLEVQGM